MGGNPCGSIFRKPFKHGLNPFGSFLCIQGTLKNGGISIQGSPFGARFFQALRSAVEDARREQEAGLSAPPCAEKSGGFA